MPLQRSILVAVAAVWLLTGCGSDDSETLSARSTSEVGTSATSAPDDQAAGDLDVCAMLSSGEVQAVLGEPGTPTNQSTGDMYGCSWEGASDPLNVLTVSIYVHPDAATAKEQYDATKEGLEGSEILGLGDEASYSEPFGLEVLSGRFDISVDNTGPTEKESDLTVAKRILDQLP